MPRPADGADEGSTQPVSRRLWHINKKTTVGIIAAALALPHFAQSSARRCFVFLFFEMVRKRGLGTVQAVQVLWLLIAELDEGCIHSVCAFGWRVP